MYADCLLIIIRSSLNQYSQLKNYKQLDKLELDIDSPCLRRAMTNLGISSEDI